MQVPVNSNRMAPPDIHTSLAAATSKAKRDGLLVTLAGCKLYESSVSARRLDEARTQCMTSLQDAVTSMAKGLEDLPGGRGLIDQLEAQAQVRMGAVLESFDSLQLLQGFEGSSSSDVGAFRVAVKQAHEAALQACGDLQKFVLNARLEAAGSDMAWLPTVAEKEKADSANESSFQVTRRMPQWETGVIRGGGAKGITYGPVVVEMADAGMLDALKCWVGTSAGALSALYLACGNTAAQFNSFTATLNAATLRNEPEGFESHYPSVRLGTVGYHGGQALRIADEESLKGVSTYLKEQVSQDQNGSITVSPEMNRMLDALGPDGTHFRGRLSDLLSRSADPAASKERSMVTFRDLKILHQLAPERFKELVLTAYEQAKGRPFYFNAETTPNLPVAFAARASMSIPNYFKLVSLQLNPGNPQRRKFIDGGVGSNIPVEAALPMRPGRSMAEAHQRTLVMAFDDNGAARNALAGDLEKMGQNLVGLGERKMSGNPNLIKARWADRAKLASTDPHNAMVVKHGKITTLNMKPSIHRVAVARGSARLHALEQLAERSGGAMRRETFTRASHAFSLLVPAEKRALQGASPEQLALQAPGGGAALRFLLELQELARDEASRDTALAPSPDSPTDVRIETKSSSS